MKLGKIVKQILIEDSNWNKTEFDKLTRPARMERPKAPYKLGRRYWKDVYIQDEFHDMLIDKYGTERGEKNFEYLIDQGGSMYTIGEQLLDEKAQMLLDLGEEPPKNYFAVNYFNLWRVWVVNHGKSVKNLSALKSKTPLKPLKEEKIKLPKGSYSIIDIYKFITELAKLKISKPNKEGKQLIWITMPKNVPNNESQSMSAQEAANIIKSKFLPNKDILGGYIWQCNSDNPSLYNSAKIESQRYDLKKVLNIIQKSQTRIQLYLGFNTIHDKAYANLIKTA